MIRRPVRRETFAAIHSQGRSRAVIVSLEAPNIIGFRLKGTRRVYTLTAEHCYWAACKAQLAMDKKEKAKAKKNR